MSRYIAAAEAAIGASITEPNQAVDPATVFALVNIVIGIVRGCGSKKGMSQAKIVAEVRSPGAGTKRALRKKLKEDLGEEEYDRLGGHKYANRILASGANARVSDVRGFVAEAVSG